MIAQRMLGLIDVMLKQAYPESMNEPFGGRSIIMFGDFGQIPSVLDIPMYANDEPKDKASEKGSAAYKQFNEAYELDVVQRQSGDSNEQQDFRDILLRLRECDGSLSDWQDDLMRM